MYKKVAVIHDFCFQYGGAEKVVEKFLEMYPESDLYTSIFVPSKFESSETLTRHFTSNKIKTTWLNAMFKWNNGFLLKYFKHFFWLYPIVMRFVVLRDYDLVLISSTDCGKQIRFNNLPKILHYCHTPTRYLHNLIDSESYKISFAQRILLPIFVFFLRPLDMMAVKYLNSKNCIWIANSIFVQGLIKDIYATNSVVIYPPIEVSKFLALERVNYSVKDNKDADFYLCHGRISFHKRIDLAIRASMELDRKLLISGTSALPQEMKNLQSIIDEFEFNHPTKKGLIKFLGRTTDEQINELISTCKALIFPGKEDFGIAPVEILSAGVPLIAYKAGGAMEYVKEGINGIYFMEQTVESLKQGILDFENITNWNENEIRESAKKFDEKVFIEKIESLLVF
jgi:glycosyltransferase involved in cell wall biosynthesis